jgi:hypothetical protein
MTFSGMQNMISQAPHAFQYVLNGFNRFSRQGNLYVECVCESVGGDVSFFFFLFFFLSRYCAERNLHRIPSCQHIHPGNRNRPASNRNEKKEKKKSQIDDEQQSNPIQSNTIQFISLFLFCVCVCGRTHLHINHDNTSIRWIQVSIERPLVRLCVHVFCHLDGWIVCRCFVSSFSSTDSLQSTTPPE